MRALAKKTDFGMEVRHQSWLMHEYTALERLHRAGAAVPEPVAANENAIVMAYQTGAGLTELLTPTNGAVMAILVASGVSFREWIGFAAGGVLLVVMVGLAGMWMLS